MIKIKKYTPEQKEVWNSFVSNSPNGLFMFNRSYMDYHSDKFIDYSLCFYKENHLVAVFPANIVDNMIFSHQGLTFGGIIRDCNTSIVTLNELFENLIQYLKSRNVNAVFYKVVPHFYNDIPFEEENYFLFKYGAQIAKVELTTTINLSNPKRTSSRRKRGIKKAIKNRLIFKQSVDWEGFWEVLKYRLAKSHNIVPTHSLEEIILLKNNFSKNIKLFIATTSQEIVSGVVIYEYNNVAHAQYIASTDLGYELCALDGLFNYLIKLYYGVKKYFDFGISTENNGKYLNQGLAKFKEEFGGGGYIHYTWKLVIN